jgi:acetylornithine deacetylase/succinyl-diaminopimelate desuccinylase-like protein
MRTFMALLLATAPAVAALPPHEAASAARDWRVKHEQQIIADLSALVAIPNLASDKPNIERNAAALVDAFTRRGASVKLLRIDGAPPLVVATIASQSSAPTYAFYAHYDGQPVDPAQWSTPPWEPVVRDGRLYGRSSSDDKAPIIAMLAAIDALHAAHAQPSVNLKFVFEGEEEAGSPHLAEYFANYADDLKTDGWLLCDGPVHQSRHMQLYFGARGVTEVEITVYGPSHALHSGHYGNWAPNPIVTLAHLIDSMRDENAHILIHHFYDDVVPLTPAEHDALAAIPPYDENLKRELALGRTEGALPLNEAILQPALNLRGFLGGHVGAQASNAIPTEARASIDFRLVPAQTPEHVRELAEAHIAKEGFFIVHDEPDAETRAAHANVAKLVWGPGYPAARTPLDALFSRRVANVLTEGSGVAPYRLPSLGGSVPMYLFTNGGRTPVVGVPIVNHDNNQHAANENVRLQNVWDGIEVFAALFSGLR